MTYPPPTTQLYPLPSIALFQRWAGLLGGGAAAASCYLAGESGEYNKANPHATQLDLYDIPDFMGYMISYSLAPPSFASDDAL